MARNFDLATGPNYVITSVGNVATLGNGAYTIIVLFNINSGNNNHGLISFRAAGINAELFVDGNQLFGAGDFAGGQTGVTVSTWWWAAIRKAAGSSVYTYSLKPYASGSATHQSGVATHADSGVSNTTVRLGDSDDRGNGLIAVWAGWTSRLSDAQVAGMFTSAAADVNAQSPQALWLGNQASSANPINDSTAGAANQTSVNGTVSVGTDPPAYDYTLSPGAAAVWLPNPRARLRVQPPRRRPKTVTPIRAQVNPPFPFTGIKQPRRLRGLLPRRAHASAPVPAQVIVVAPNVIAVFTRAKALRGLLRRRPVASTPVPAQIVTPPIYPPAPVRVRVRGLLRRRPVAAAPPIDQQQAPGTVNRARPKLPRLFRPRAIVAPQQQSVAPATPPYPLQSVRLRIRGLLLRRPRAVSPVPAQIAPPATPGYTPLAVRARLRFGRLFRGRQAAPVPTQPTAPPAPHLRPHPAPPRRGRSFAPVPPQVAPPIPPGYPVRPSRPRLKGLRLLRGRSATPVRQQEVQPPVPPVPPTPTPVKTGSWWSLVSVLKEARAEAQQEQPKSCPNDGEPLRLSTDGYWFCLYDGFVLGDVPMNRNVASADWGGLKGVINSTKADASEDRGRLLLACPNDGEPFSTSVDGIRYCRFDGFRPDGEEIPLNPSSG